MGHIDGVTAFVKMLVYVVVVGWFDKGSFPLFLWEKKEIIRSYFIYKIKNLQVFCPILRKSSHASSYDGSTICLLYWKESWALMSSLNPLIGLLVFLHFNLRNFILRLWRLELFHSAIDYHLLLLIPKILSE